MPIIDPMLFYWISVFNSLKLVFIVLFVVSVIGFVGFLVFSFDEYVDGNRVKITRDIFAVLAVMSAIGLIFIPSKETMIEMLIAKYATVENAEWTIENIKSIADYIVNAIQTTK